MSPLLAKIGVLLLIIGTLGFSIWLSAHEAYDRGLATQKLLDQHAMDEANAKAIAAEAKLFAATQKQVAPIEQQATTSIQIAQNALPPQQKIIVETIHDTPSYASYKRPAAVERLRVADLSDIAALATQSASAASASASAVPRTGQQ